MRQKNSWEIEGAQKTSLRSEFLFHSSHLWCLQGIFRSILTHPHWFMPKLNIFSFLFMETNFSASLVFSLLLASLYRALLSEHIFIGTLKTVFMGQLLEAGISLLVINVIKYWEQNLIWWIAGHRGETTCSAPWQGGRGLRQVMWL